MPRAPSSAIQNNFIKGLITESTGLNFPENACTETDNCIFNRTGLVERRHAFQIEGNEVPYEATLVGRAITSYVWKNVAGEGELKFAVIQIGRFIHFYKVVNNQPLSATKHSHIIDTADFLAPSATADVNNAEFNYTSGNGYLFCTSPSHDAFYVEYDIDTDTFTETEINIKIRDFDGIEEDPFDEEDRPRGNIKLGEIDTRHMYNLVNQGWNAQTLSKWVADRNGKDAPSNSDVPWFYKDSEGNYEFKNMPDRIIGSLAPKGHFKYSLYDINRKIPELDFHDNGRDFHIDETGVERIRIQDQRLSTCAFFAGRVFYSGLNASKHNSKVFFTQIIEKPDQFGKCYQKNDPASEKLFDLLPTDGGVVDLNEAGSIKKLFPMLNALIVFASNGIWAISGSSGIGFTANDFSVQKVSSIEIPSRNSFVDAEGIPYWWSESGIYTIMSGQQGGLQVINLTDDTIKDFYDAIPFENKTYARGIYDPIEKVIQWVYRDARIATFVHKYIFDSVLNYNVLTKAFYPWSVDVTTVQLHGLMNITNFGNDYTMDNVEDSGNQVVDGTDTIVAFSVRGATSNSVTKFLASYVADGATQFTFAESNDTTDGYVDWTFVDGEASDGSSYDSYFVTGYSLKGQANRRWQPIYVNMFSQCDENNTYKIRGRWNFSTSGATGKWSLFQQFINTANDFKYETNRFKIRGDGIACQFEVRNVGDSPFFIIGWASFDSATRWV